MRVPTWLLAVVAVTAVGLAVRQETSAGGPDYCAAANMRSCRVADQGDFVIVTSGDRAYLLLVKNGKVLSSQQLQ